MTRTRKAPGLQIREGEAALPAVAEKYFPAYGKWSFYRIAANSSTSSGKCPLRMRHSWG